MSIECTCGSRDIRTLWYLYFVGTECTRCSRDIRTLLSLYFDTVCMLCSRDICTLADLSFVAASCTGGSRDIRTLLDSYFAAGLSTSRVPGICTLRYVYFVGVEGPRTGPGFD